MKTKPFLSSLLSRLPLASAGKAFIFSLLSFIFYPLSSQIPQGFNYQAVARDGVTGNPITNAIIKVKLSVLSDTTGFYGGTGGVYIWEEEHTNVKTSSFGMFTVVLGDPTAVKIQGSATSFSEIDWSPANLFVGTKVANPADYIVMGSAKLWSVPYALRTKDSEQWQTSGTDIYRAAGNVGIGTSSPASKLHVHSSTGQQVMAGSYSSMSGSGGGHGLFGSNVYIDFTGSIIRSAYTHPSLGSSGMVFNKPAWHNVGVFINSPPSTQNQEIAPNYIATFTTMGLGIGTSSPISKLHVKANAASLSLEGIDHTYMTFFPQGGASGRKAWLGFGGAGTTVFSIRNENTTGGHISFVPGSGANVGIGTDAPSGRLTIQTPSGWDDNTPLFEVKNKLGVPIFSVYNNGIRILVDHTDGKAVKGGFAIGGYDFTKAGRTVDLMTISPDSIRFNINNDNTKGPKGGFAIGGFDITGKGPINQDFMYVTPQYSNAGTYNTVLGYMAGRYITLGGDYNTIIGYQSVYNNVFTGASNVVIGFKSGYSLSSGANNVLVGFESGGLLTSGYKNSYIGNLSGRSSTSAANNVALGDSAGYNLQTGRYNVCIGNSTSQSDNGYGNTYIGYRAGAGVSGSQSFGNVFIGYKAGEKCRGGSLYGTIPPPFDEYYGSGNLCIGTGSGNSLSANSPYTAKEASDNVFLGTASGQKTTYGNSNVFIGREAGTNNTTGTNNIAIGYGAQVRTATATNEIRLGNSSIVYAGIEVAWTVTSDLKLKESIEDLTFGLNIINGLKPVDYIRRNNTQRTREAGFIAQDVEKLFDELGLQNSGLISKDSDGLLSLRYNDFIPVLTKAIQEQQFQIESQDRENRQLRSELQAIKDELEQIKGMLGNR